MKRRRNTILRVACLIVLAMCAVFVKPDITKAQAAEWYKDYQIYQFVQVNGDNYLDISCYNGNATAIYVPAYTTVDGVLYRTRVRGSISKKEDIMSIRFEKDVKFTGDCSYMFFNLKSLETINTENMDVSEVTDMTGMFTGCASLSRLDLSTWDTSKVTSMGYMFSDCPALAKLNLSGWNTSNVTNMENMFYGCKKIKKLDLRKWDTSKVTNMSNMFNWCTALEQVKVKGWNTSKVTKMNGMFACAFSLTSIDLSSFDMGKVKFDKKDPLAKQMFLRCASLKTIKTPKRLKTRIPITNLLTYTQKGTLNSYDYIPKTKKSITLICNKKQSPATKITKVTSKKGKITLTWEKMPLPENGMSPQYEVQCSTNKNFTDNVGKMVKPMENSGTYSVEDDMTEKTKATIKKLESGKVYYVRVRVCEWGQRISKWSNVKKIKVK